MCITQLTPRIISYTWTCAYLHKLDRSFSWRVFKYLSRTREKTNWLRNTLEKFQIALSTRAICGNRDWRRYCYSLSPVQALPGEDMGRNFSDLWTDTFPQFGSDFNSFRLQKSTKVGANCKNKRTFGAVKTGVTNFNFPCSLTRNITSHSMENLAFHSLLRWKMIMLPILTTSPIHLSLDSWENVLFGLGSERVYLFSGLAHRSRPSNSSFHPFNAGSWASYEFYIQAKLCANNQHRMGKGVVLKGRSNNLGHHSPLGNHLDKTKEINKPSWHFPTQRLNLPKPLRPVLLIEPQINKLEVSCIFVQGWNYSYASREVSG